jgi:hypothetical protein
MKKRECCRTWGVPMLPTKQRPRVYQAISAWTSTPSPGDAIIRDRLYKSQHRLKALSGYTRTMDIA